MKGAIKEIHVSELGNVFGYIIGEDKKKYYFSKLSILPLEIEDFSIGDKVAFTPIAPRFGEGNGTANRVTLEKKLPESPTIEDSEHKQTYTDNTNEGIKAEDALFLRFYRTGFPRNLNTSIAFEKNLKDHSNEDVIIEKLSRILYISRIGNHIMDQSSKYEFCLAGATKEFKQYIRGQNEFIIVFSYFGNAAWQQKTLVVEREIRKRKEIIDRNPLVNFYILVCNASNLINEINTVKGRPTAAVIPFTFQEIINSTDSKSLLALFLERFGEYFFENNMLGETNAIDDDNLLFGDRGKVADIVVQRCHQHNNSGIFGLRRSGKSSVLNAVARRLERDGIKYVKIEARSDLETVDSWRTALFDIARKIREKTLELRQMSGEDRIQYKKRLHLNSTEEDYSRRPAQTFVEDVKLYCTNEQVFVIMIDEVELITYNTAKTPTWKSVEAYCGFWGAIRDCGCSLVVSGVNSTINEINAISFNGIEGDNPMYGRIISCADSSSTYLPTFNDEQTKHMINTLGGYSHIAFSNVYAEINRAFGGQPYAIRQFCSFVFEKVKGSRTKDSVFEVSKAAVENLLSEFMNSAAGLSLCEIILQHLTIFREEYEMLKNIALVPEKYRVIHAHDIAQIDHLQKYGLIEYDYATGYTSFRIHMIKEYIRRNNTKNPRDMTNDERRRYIQDCVAECEIKLKTYIRNIYVFTSSEAELRNIMKQYLMNKKVIRIKSTPAPDFETCAINDFFDHNIIIFHFSSIKRIILDNWAKLGHKLQAVCIDRDKFSSYMEDLNAGRTDADHYDAEDKSRYPEGWEITDTILDNFINAYTNLNRFFSACSL